MGSLALFTGFGQFEVAKVETGVLRTQTQFLVLVSVSPTRDIIAYHSDWQLLEFLLNVQG